MIIKFEDFVLNMDDVILIVKEEEQCYSVVDFYFYYIRAITKNNNKIEIFSSRASLYIEFNKDGSEVEEFKKINEENKAKAKEQRDDKFKEISSLID